MAAFLTGKRPLTSLLGAAIVTFLVPATAAWADNFALLGPLNSFQDYNRGRNVSVLQRERPEYTPQGLIVGAFTVLPGVDTGLGADSNVFATNSSTKSDGFFTFTPDIDAQSNWTRNSLQASVGLDLLDYFSKTSENQTNWHANVIGRYDLQGDSYVLGGAQARRDYIDRFNVAFPDNANEPVPVTTYQGFGRGVYQFNRFRASGLVSIEHQDYDNVNAVGGGVLDQSSRDLNTYLLGGRLDYAISPDTAIFVNTQYYKYDYTNSGTFNRNSDLTLTTVGANFDISALVRGEASIGYQSKTYDSHTFQNINGLALAAKVEYFPSPLTTLTATAARSIQDSILGSTGGYFDTNIAAQVDHELLRNLLLNASVGFEQDDFRGVNRTDKVYSVKAGATYLVDQHWAIKGSVGYQSRSSSGSAPGREYDDVRAVITIGYHF